MIIIAPHVDDEVIGCYRLLAKKQITDVYYLFDLTEERKKEAIRCSEHFEFNPHFLSSEDTITAIKEKHSKVPVLIPCIQDDHHHHKMVNTWFRNLSPHIQFYSVDMNTPAVKPLYENEKRIKELTLKAINHSQASLFRQTDKYFLFESDPVDFDGIITTRHLYKNIVVEIGVYGKKDVDLNFVYKVESLIQTSMSEFTITEIANFIKSNLTVNCSVKVSSSNEGWGNLTSVYLPM